jgi:hypothetical protein
MTNFGYFLKLIKKAVSDYDAIIVRVEKNHYK